MNSLLIQTNFIQSIIKSATDEDTGLSYSFIVHWFCMDIDSGHDAMGVMLMGGEL